MYLVDSHCHLDYFGTDEIGPLLDRAVEAGLGEVVTIGTRLSKADQQKSLCQLTRPDMRIWCTIGTHPSHVEDEPFMTGDEIAELSQSEAVIGIGETGLDYFYGQPEIFSLQQKFFREHIKAAQKTQLPLCIHARQADEDIEMILREETKIGGKFPFLLHCFSSGANLAKAALELGGYISISGIVTFKKAEQLREILVNIPLDHILVETDSPYLAPVPYRGKTNEPSYVVRTAACVAEIKNIALTDLIEQTTINFHRLFTKAKIG